MCIYVRLYNSAADANRSSLYAKMYAYMCVFMHTHTHTHIMQPLAPIASASNRYEVLAPGLSQPVQNWGDMDENEWEPGEARSGTGVFSRPTNAYRRPSLVIESCE